jgi:hypothetical protein
VERVSSLYLKHEGFYHKEFFLLCAHDSDGMIAMFAVVVKFFGTYIVQKAKAEFVDSTKY